MLVLLLLPAVVSAHREDEYLQAILVMIEPHAVRLQVNLTPGIAVAERVIKLIDQNGDDEIFPGEARAYAELLRSELAVTLDRRTLPLNVHIFEFAEPEQLRTGSGLIQMEFTAPVGPLTAGAHGLTLNNSHQRAISVYLINAAQPKFKNIQISAQKRNDNQSAGEIEFIFGPIGAKSSRSVR
jgi:hypothetical protein